MGKESESGEEAEAERGGDGGEQKAVRRELLADRWRLRRDIAGGVRFGDFLLFGNGEREGGGVRRLRAFKRGSEDMDPSG